MRAVRRAVAALAAVAILALASPAPVPVDAAFASAVSGAGAISACTCHCPAHQALNRAVARALTLADACAPSSARAIVLVQTTLAGPTCAWLPAAPRGDRTPAWSYDARPVTQDALPEPRPPRLDLPSA